MIQWLAVRLKISDEDHVEAVKMAILLCHYGYIFPVGDLRNLTVKEDASLYRFQVSMSSSIAEQFGYVSYKLSIYVIYV